MNRLGETGRMAQHDGNKQRGWVNYFRVLAGGYLLYLAYQLMKGIWDGTAETVALNAAAGRSVRRGRGDGALAGVEGVPVRQGSRTTRIAGARTTPCRSRSVRRHLQNRSDPKRTRRDGTNEAGRALRRRAGGALLQRAVHPPGSTPAPSGPTRSDSDHCTWRPSGRRRRTLTAAGYWRTELLDLLEAGWKRQRPWNRTMVQARKSRCW